MKTGDKVVCVDDHWSNCWSDPRPWFSSLPIAGKVYVVSGFTLAPNGKTGVTLVGITGVPYSNGNPAGFYPHRFRLLDEVRREEIACVVARNGGEVRRVQSYKI